MAYVVLIGKHDEFTGNSLGLENVEGREAFGYGETIIEFAVDDLIRKACVVSMSARQPKKMIDC